MKVQLEVKELLITSKPMQYRHAYTTLCYAY